MPGVVIDYSPATTRVYVGSPALSVLPTGEYIASHDFFGPGSDKNRTDVFNSEDRGRTWRRIATLTGLPRICPDAPEWFTQFFAAPLPDVDPDLLKRRLYDEYRIEVPVFRWNGTPLIRVSFQAYNDQWDADALVDALTRLLPELA